MMGGKILERLIGGKYTVSVNKFKAYRFCLGNKEEIIATY